MSTNNTDSSSSSNNNNNTNNNHGSNGDVYSRNQTSSSSGRGSLAGWTTCPLCPPKRTNQKKYALGRGISSHLHAVHTPWKTNVSKRLRKLKEGERRRKMNELRRLQGNKRKRGQDDDNADEDEDGDERERKEEDGCIERGNQVAVEVEEEEEEVPEQQQEPTPEQIRQWNERVVQLTAQVEQEFILAQQNQQQQQQQQQQENNKGQTSTHPPPPTKKRRRGRRDKNNNKNDDPNQNNNFVPAGYDRNGNKVSSYADSLPTFLKLASDGNLDGLRHFVKNQQKEQEGKEQEVIVTLLSITDRNGSTAEHWAAGGGHLSCLEYLYELKGQITNDDTPIAESIVVEEKKEQNENEQVSQQSRRNNKRSGKTSLHFAARYGHNSIIQYLLNHHRSKYFPNVDVTSGDGTTPLHLACYGGHYETVVLLIETYHADPNKVNDWGCSAAHWAAMSSSSSSNSSCVDICHYLRWKQFVSFTITQKQNHTPLHKAAQRLNSRVIEWFFRDKEENGAGLTVDERLFIGRIKDNEGGNLASDIWVKMGGDEEFCKKMKDKFGC